MTYLKKIGIGMCIVMGAALCFGWCYLKADTLQREGKMITNLFNGE